MLGSAPQPGVERQIRRQELDRALAEHPELQEELILPETVTIRRCHRQITPAELESTVIDALKKCGASDSQLAKIKGTGLSAPIYVTEADPGLRVMSIEYDALHEETQLRLWTAREPQLLPFYVSLHGRINLPALAAGRQAPVQQVTTPGPRSEALARPRRSQAGSFRPSLFEPVSPLASETRRTRRGRMSAVEALVKAGTPAKLYFNGTGFRIETEVIPLESGAEGQVIKVRRQDNHRLLTGQVVGPGLLQAD